MITVTLVILLVLAMAGAALWKVALRLRSRASERRWLPRELARARLALAEKTFRTVRPMRLIARVDRGYWLNGQLHLTELKTRARAVAYLSDVIGLSAQRLVVEQSSGKRVNEVGHVLVQDESRTHRSVHRVRLLPAEDVIALAKRRVAIVEGRVAPRYPPFEGLCRRCAWRTECKPDHRERGQLTLAVASQRPPITLIDRRHS